MIIELFSVLMILSFVLIYFGYRFDAIVLKVIGFGFIFLIGIGTFDFNGGFEYHTGDNVTDLGGGNKQITMTYDSYVSRTISIFLCAIGFLGATILTWDEYKERNRW